MNRIRIKVAGESGAGLLSVGEILTKGLMSLGYEVIADREYPSLIRGGHSCFMVNASNKDINSLSRESDVLLVIDKPSMEAYVDDVIDGGVLIHGYERLEGVVSLLDSAEERGVQVVSMPARTTAEELGGNVLFQNIVLLGMLWKTLGFDYESIEAQVKWKFASKPRFLEMDLKCLMAGYNGVESIFGFEKVESIDEDRLFINGNRALALGAVHAGCRAYFAYPMSPSSSILTYMANMAEKTGMAVKQVEDEISVANMTLGAMYMGTRALCATSGGGLDLMSETVSLAGITETPLVIIDVQRPGPGTGLPTWTAQGDLALAINCGHGEFGRAVIAVSDPEDCFVLIQEALNVAEKYQVPVVVLSEKVIAESNWTVPRFEEGTVEIERGLSSGKLENADRFRITEGGVSKRWVPGSNEAYYFANGDEHWEDGSLTEDENAGEMYEKRVRKLETMKAEFPEPVIYGQESGARFSFVGFGSSKNVMKDVIKESGANVNYLHFSHLYPLKTEKLKKFFEENKTVHILEGNCTGQLAKLIRQETGLEFKGKLLKYNGRPFFVEDVLDYINANL